MITRYTIHDDNGQASLVAFLHADGAFSLLWRSAGGSEQTRQYKEHLTTLLRRAGRQGMKLDRVAVESSSKAVKNLSLENRTLPLAAADAWAAASETPVFELTAGRPAIVLGALSDEGADKLRQRIGTLAAKIGRAPGAKGGGNSVKSLRLYFTTRISAAVAQTLAGSGSTSSRQGAAA